MFVMISFSKHIFQRQFTHCCNWYGAEWYQYCFEHFSLKIVWKCCGVIPREWGDPFVSQHESSPKSLKIIIFIQKRLMAPNFLRVHFMTFWTLFSMSNLCTEFWTFLDFFWNFFNIAVMVTFSKNNFIYALKMHWLGLQLKWLFQTIWLKWGKRRRELNAYSIYQANHKVLLYNCMTLQILHM